MKNKILNIFEELKTKRIKNCYLRDELTFEIFLNTLTGDIDLLINSKEYKVVKELLNDYNYFNLFDNHAFIDFTDDSSFDIYNDYYERYPFINIDKVKRINKYKISNVNYLEKSIQSLILLLHPMDLFGIRGHRNYSKEREKFIKSVIEENKIFVEDYLISNFGQKFTLKLMNYIQNDEFDKIKQDNLKFKLFMYLHKPSYFKYFLQRLKKKIIKPQYQKSKLIIFMGVDGSGKTTAAQNSIEFMKRYYGNNASKIEYFYLGSQGGYILPLVGIAQLKDKLKAFLKKERVQKIDRAKNENIVSSNHGKLKETMLVFEYIVRYIKLQYLLKIKNKIVVSDRYLYDYFRTDNTDPKVVKFFSKFFPKPDFIFMMEGDTQKFYDRKKEYSPKILKEHQSDLINGLKKEKLDFISIDANQDEEDVLKSILRKLGD